jgi:hypothetical protein
MMSCYLIGLKMRGRPKGSKNKPKVPGAETTAAAPKAVVAPPPKFTDKDFDQLKTAEKKRTRYRQCGKKRISQNSLYLSEYGSLPVICYERRTCSKEERNNSIELHSPDNVWLFHKKVNISYEAAKNQSESGFVKLTGSWLP